MEKRERCPICGGAGLSNCWDLRGELDEPDAALFYIKCTGCGRRGAPADTADAAEAAWNKYTNADRLRKMTDKELGDFLHEVGVSEVPWETAFSKAFCDSCGPDTCDYDGDCPHGRPVDWWLEQEATDGKTD